MGVFRQTAVGGNAKEKKMTEWLIILIALWTYPIIEYLLFFLTKKKIDLRKKIFKVIFIISVLAIVGLLTKISTTITELDWIIITIPFLAVTILLWWSQFQKSRIIKITGIIAMIFVFGIGYLSGTVGALGVGFVIEEFETSNEIWLDNGLIYKETSLGNAISDYRGKRVEIYRTIKWLPLIEWQVTSKEYFNLMVYGQPLNINYNSVNQELYLDIEKQWGDSTYYWNDTLRFEK